MLTTSAVYNSLLVDANHSVEWKISVNGTDYGMSDISSMSGGGNSFPHLSRHLLPGSSPSVGGCVAATFECSIFEASSNVPRMATVVPSFRLVSGSTVSEWIALGTFLIDTRSVNASTGELSLYCYDKMLKTDGAGGANYADVTSYTTWPQSMASVVSEIATIIGVSVDSRTTINTGTGFTVDDPGDYTMREVLGFIGAAHAGNWCITPEGKLYLVPLTGGSGSINIGTAAASLTVSRALSAWSGVTIITDAQSPISVGDDSGTRLTLECPWATIETANSILSAIQNTQYQPFSASGAFSNLALELGDIVTVGFPGETVTGPCFSLVTNCDVLEYTDISAPGEAEVDHEYPYISSNRRSEKRLFKDIDELNDRIYEVEETVEQDIQGMLLRAINLNFSRWSEGVYQETLETNELVEYSVQFDQYDRPIQVSDGVHTCSITWGAYTP